MNTNNNIVGYFMSGVSFASIGISQIGGLESISLYIALASACFSLLYTSVRFIFMIIEKYKESKKDGVITKEEKKEMKEMVNKYKENLLKDLQATKENLDGINAKPQGFNGESSEGLRN